MHTNCSEHNRPPCNYPELQHKIDTEIKNHKMKITNFHSQVSTHTHTHTIWNTWDY